MRMEERGIAYQFKTFLGLPYIVVPAAKSD